MRIGILFSAFFLIVGSAAAQMTDPEQRMYWFNLQRLATEAAELEQCSLSNLDEPKYRSAAYSAAAETAAAIEQYLKKYPEARFKQETPDAFRYRVWTVSAWLQG